MSRNTLKRNVTHSRIDRFTQMSKQEEIIAEKKREIEAKLKAKTKTSKDDEKGSVTEAKEDKKNIVSSNESTQPVEEPIKVNVFSNDGSFLEQFKKLSDSSEANRKYSQENTIEPETHDDSKRVRSNKYEDRPTTARNECRNVGRVNRHNESRNNDYRNFDNHNNDMRHNDNRNYDHRSNDNRNNDNRYHGNRHNDYRNNGSRQNEGRNYDGRRNNHRDDDRRNSWDNREDGNREYGLNRHNDDRNWNRNKDNNHYSFNKESNNSQTYQNNSFRCSQESVQNNHNFSSSFNNGLRSLQSFNSQFESNTNNHSLQSGNNMQSNQFNFNGNDGMKNNNQSEFLNRPIQCSNLQMPSNQFDVSSPPPVFPSQSQGSHSGILPLLSTNLNIHTQNIVPQSHRHDAPPPLLTTINTNVPPPNMVPIHSIPEPKPLQANLIPSPGPLNLQSIPPPLPICVNQIPKPKEMDLGNIPPPKQFNLSKIQIPDDYNNGLKNNQVLSTDSRHSLAQPQLQNENEAIHRIAKMVAENGDVFEEKLKQSSQHDPDVWFLFDKSTRTYKEYENILNKLKAENNTEEVKYNPYDIYHPEFSLDDDENDIEDSKVDIKIIKSENNVYHDYKEDAHLNSSPLKWKDEDQDDKYFDGSKPKRKRRSRWADEPQMNVPPPSVLNIPGLGDVATGAITLPLPLPMQAGPTLLSKITRTDPALLQYAQNTFGTTNLSEEDWAKAEDHYKINLLYQDMLRKRNELDRLSKSGKFKYDYDSDEETEGGTWEHKLRMQEMEATQAWSSELTKKSEGKHHIGDFLPPDELKKFMEQYSAVKHGREPDISDYKEYKLKENNVGFQMLQKLGWKEGEGLGAEGGGIIDPVNKAFQRDSNQGLGVDRPDTIAQNDNEYDAYRKRMMLAYRFRPNPLNNPRRPYY